jgi:hypothetical protein
MAALFYNDMLSNEDIYKIANNLTNRISDDDLISILVNGTDDDNNKKLFENYLNKLKINYLNPKKALIAKIFYYILHNKIGADEGIVFVANNISIFENTTNYVGDDVGIEHILGNYYAIADGDIVDRKGIDETEKILSEEIRQYIQDNLK